MSLTILLPAEKSRLRALLDHFSVVEDPREPWRVAHPLPEVLLLVVYGTIADCDDHEAIAEWGQTHLTFLRRVLPYHHGIPGARWLTILMNRIDPELFSSAFSSGCGRRGPIGWTSSPSTARPHAEVTTAAPTRPRFTSSPLSQPPAVSCSASRRRRQDQ